MCYNHRCFGILLMIMTAMKLFSPKILIILFAAALVLPALLVSQAPNGEVAVFVIDSACGILPESKRKLDLFENLEHGTAVREIIEEHVSKDDLRFFNIDDENGNIDNRRYLAALSYISDFADKNADHPHPAVVNLSFGSRNADSAEKRLITELCNKGVILVASAGNSGGQSVSYPAAYDEVIAVGSSVSRQIASYSNRGEDVDILAEGMFRSFETVSFTSHRGFERKSRRVVLTGTSFAAPRVTSLIIRLIRADPDIKRDEIIRLIQRSSKPIMASEVGSIDPPKTLAQISRRYKVLYMFRKYGVLIMTSLFFAVVFAVVAVIFDTILVQITTEAVRILFPGWWSAGRIRKIQKITAKMSYTPRQIRYLIDCLRPAYPELMQKAEQALLSIGQPAVKHLVNRYDYAVCNEFRDSKTPIENTLAKIGGSQANKFLAEINYYKIQQQ